MDRAEQLLVRVDVQARDVDGQDDIGRRARAFRLQALRQSLRCIDDVDFRSIFLGVGIEERLDQERLAVRIDVQLIRGHRRSQRHDAESKCDTARHKAATDQEC